MSTNAFNQLLVITVLLAHAGILVGVWYSPRGLGYLLSLNAAIAAAVLLYAASRARYIFAAMDWPFLGLVVLELLVLLGVYFAFRGSRLAVVSSYVAFGLHTCISIGAVLFAFLFKINRLM